MENAIDALKIAFAVFVFVMALTVSMTMFSQLNKTSQIVLASSDITTYYNYNLAADENQNRIVGLETIIPTLYKYYKENYTVLFLDKIKADGTYTPLGLYNSQTDRALWGTGINYSTGRNESAGNIAKYYTKNKNSYTTYDNVYDQKKVCTFDVDEETIRHEPWTGNSTDFKRNLDAFLFGKVFEYPSGDGNSYNYAKQVGTGGFVAKYSKSKFKEISGEYTYNLVEENTDEEDEEFSSSGGNALIKNRKKRVIIYQLQ